MRLNREQHSFTVKHAMFPNTTKRFALTKKKKIHVCPNKWRAEWWEGGRKRHDLFSKLLWCFPLFPSRFSLHAHYDCQWGRNCCRDTKELLKLHLWQLLAMGCLRDKRVLSKTHGHCTEKKNQYTAKALLQVSVTLKILYYQHTLLCL